MFPLFILVALCVLAKMSGVSLKNILVGIGLYVVGMFVLQHMGAPVATGFGIDLLHRGANTFRAF